MYVKNVVVSKNKELASSFLKSLNLSYEQRNRIAIVTSLVGLYSFDVRRTKFIKVGSLPKSLDDMLNTYIAQGAEVLTATPTGGNDE